jgi:hypothetical protein
MWDGCDSAVPYLNERFHVSGRIVSAPLTGAVEGQCAGWAGDALGDGTTAQVRGCDAPPLPVTQSDGTTWTPIDPQTWDLYWP